MARSVLNGETQPFADSAAAPVDREPQCLLTKD
jgi:hypothetical protein